MVTHRVQTLKICDEILFFDDGKLIEKGNYDHLIKTSPKFKDMEENNSTENSLKK